MIRCAGKIKYKVRFKRCKNKAVYREDAYTELCRDCWGKQADYLFKKWHIWFESDQSKTEPTLWVYDSKKIIG